MLVNIYQIIPMHSRQRVIASNTLAYIDFIQSKGCTVTEVESSIYTHEINITPERLIQLNSEYLDNGRYSPLSEENKSRLFDKGVRYGYPVCCINEFIDNYGKAILHTSAFTGSGYIPCKSCTLKEPTKLKMEINENRTVESLFPYPDLAHFTDTNNRVTKDITRLLATVMSSYNDIYNCIASLENPPMELVQYTERLEKIRKFNQEIRTELEDHRFDYMSPRMDHNLPVNVSPRRVSFIADNFVQANDTLRKVQRGSGVYIAAVYQTFEDDCRVAVQWNLQNPDFNNSANYRPMLKSEGIKEYLVEICGENSTAVKTFTPTTMSGNEHICKFLHVAVQP